MELHCSTVELDLPNPNYKVINYLFVGKKV